MSEKLLESGTMQGVQPRMRILTEGQADQVHEYSLRLLASVGIRVDSERALRIFRAAGATVVDGALVCIPRELVEFALNAAPSTIDVYDRAGKLAFRLGEDRTRFGIGVTALYYQDPETDRVAPFTRKHMELSVRLGQVLSNYDVVSTIGIVQDVPPSVADLFATLEMVANTVKPLVVLVSDEECFPAVMDLLEYLHGDLASHPFVIPYFNPVTPLVMNEGTVDKMLVTIERHLPFIYSNLGMAGVTTPITPAGSLVLLNAELLAGLTLSQLVAPGTPVILGSLPTSFDMKQMLSSYDPPSILTGLCCAEMMAYYHLPHCGTSGSGNGWGPDLLAGGTQWLNHLTGCMARVGLAPFVGSVLRSKVFSPASAVYAHEVISQALMFARGFTINDESVGLDQIAQAGPGGHFLKSPLTRSLFRTAYFQSNIFPELSLEKWQEMDYPQATAMLRHCTRQLLDNLPPPQDYADLMQRGNSFVRKFEAGWR